MLSSPSVDQLHLRLQERIAEAQHAALVREARNASASSLPKRNRLMLRARMAGALRELACRLDSSLAVPA
jgi:hypothetical protein